MNNIFAFAVKQRHIECLRLSLLRIQPLHLKLWILLLTVTKHLKAVILPLIIHQKDTNPLIRIITLINGTDTLLQRIHRIIDRDDQRNLRIDRRLYDLFMKYMLLDQDKHTSKRRYDLHHHRNDDPCRPE